jgi:hypothetical protein
VGYSAYAYTVEAYAENAAVMQTVNCYRAPGGETALFSWAQGERAPGMHEYADGSLFCDAPLQLLSGYPRRERAEAADGLPDRVLLEHNFSARSREEPVLFHLLLPPRFVPRPNLDPLIQPSRPNIALRSDQLVVTYLSRGGADVRFWIECLQPSEKWADFDLTRVLREPATRSTKASLKFAAGPFEFTLGG